MDKFNSLIARSLLAISEMRDREEGQALVEYALLLSLIAVASIGILDRKSTRLNSSHRH